MFISHTRRALLAATVAVSAALGGFTAIAHADGHAVTDKLHFLIPGGAGGGWDGTARGTGEALTNSGMVGSATYENMSGGGGGKAIAHLIETAGEQSGTLMVNSTPIVIRSLQKVFPQSFRDLTPIAGTIGDYAALVVKADSDIKSVEDLIAAYKNDPNSVGIAGGSVAGSMDHIVAALIMKNAGADATKVKYVPFDTGGPAMASLLGGETQALSTGFSEAVGMAEQGEVRVLCITAPARISDYPDVPTCAESGAPGTDFVNWRGFFGAPGLDEATAKKYADALGAVQKTPEWEEIRKRNGWVNIYNPGAEFTAFLEKQEEEIGGLMKELGFL
ncbi:MAG: tripartite tricarboxylate transporter substrate-binding protein [Pseudomonadota bacterium]